MGNALKEQGKLEEAIEAYNKALAIKPDYAEAYNNMGNALKEQGKLEEAIEAYNKALAIKPDYAEAYYNMGNALKEQGKLEEAIEAYNKALAIKPDYEGARVKSSTQQAHICDWSSIAKDIERLPRLGTTKEYVSPFDLAVFGRFSRAPSNSCGNICGSDLPTEAFTRAGEAIPKAQTHSTWILQQ